MSFYVLCICSFGLPPSSNASSNTGSAPDNTSNAGMAQLLQMLSGQPSGGGGGTTSQAPSTNTDNTGGGGGGGGGGGEQLSPEERLARRYRVQLNILEGMGFLERAANLQGTL